jgi:hypothetical protein
MTTQEAILILQLNSGKYKKKDNTKENREKQLISNDGIKFVTV